MRTCHNVEVTIGEKEVPGVVGISFAVESRYNEHGGLERYGPSEIRIIRAPSDSSELRDLYGRPEEARTPRDLTVRWLGDDGTPLWTAQASHVRHKSLSYEKDPAGTPAEILVLVAGKLLFTEQKE